MLPVILTLAADLLKPVFKSLLNFIYSVTRIFAFTFLSKKKLKCFVGGYRVSEKIEKFLPIEMKDKFDLERHASEISEIGETLQNEKLSMSEGQMNAILLISSLVRTFFGNKQKEFIEISQPTYGQSREEYLKSIKGLDYNILSIGGPVNNCFSQIIFEKLEPFKIGFSTDSRPYSLITPKLDGDLQGKKLKYSAEGENYSWLIFFNNPYSKNRKVIIYSGIDHLGTHAAAKVHSGMYRRCFLARMRQAISYLFTNKKFHNGTAILVKYDKLGNNIRNEKIETAFSIPKSSP